MEKHSKLVEKGNLMLNPMRFEDYRQLLEAQQDPFPLMVCVRYNHAQAAAFVKSIQETIHEQDSDYSLDLLESNMFYPSFAWLNAQFIVLYTHEVDVFQQFSDQNFVKFLE